MPAAQESDEPVADQVRSVLRSLQGMALRIPDAGPEARGVLLRSADLALDRLWELLPEETRAKLRAEYQEAFPV